MARFSLGDTVNILGCPIDLRNPMDHVHAMGVVMKARGNQAIVKDFNGRIWLFYTKDLEKAYQ